MALRLEDLAANAETTRVTSAQALEGAGFALSSDDVRTCATSARDNGRDWLAVRLDDLADSLARAGR